jgi:hypothetical protein
MMGRLTVMHCSLGGITTKRSRDNNCFFSTFQVSSQKVRAKEGSHLSVNHPSFPLSLLVVCVGLGGMRKNAAIPIIPVKIP